MKLSYNEMSKIMTFCNKNVIFKILPMTGKLRYYSSRMLSDYESVCGSIIDIREEVYKERDIVSDIDIFEEFIDTIGMDDGNIHKESIYYDKRLESIFSVHATNGSKFLLTKENGKILLEKPYEHYASASISAFVSLIILPWIQDRRHNFNDMTEDQLMYINTVYSLIPKENDQEWECLAYNQIGIILHYLYSLYEYFKNPNKVQLPRKHKHIIRNISKLIIKESQ